MDSGEGGLECISSVCRVYMDRDKARRTMGECKSRYSVWSSDFSEWPASPVQCLFPFSVGRRAKNTDCAAPLMVWINSDIFSYNVKAG